MVVVVFAASLFYVAEVAEQGHRVAKLRNFYEKKGVPSFFLLTTGRFFAKIVPREYSLGILLITV